MKENDRRRLHRVFGIALAFMLAVSAVCLIVGCVSIYLSGDNPFTYESIGRTFSYIAVPVVLTLAGVVASAVLRIAFPVNKERLRASPDSAAVLGRLVERADESALGSESRIALERERRFRRVMHTVCISLDALSAVLSLCYLLNAGNFPEDMPTESVRKASLVIIGCAAPAFGFHIVRIFMDGRSVRREIELLRSAPKASAKLSCDNTVEAVGGIRGFVNAHRRQLTLALRISVAVLAVGFVTVGFAMGGGMEVVKKAIKLCKECIGMG